MRFIRPFTSSLLLGCLVLVLSSCVLQEPAVMPTSAPEPTPTPIIIIQTPTPVSDLDVAERRIIEVYQEVNPAVVHITAQLLRPDFFFGVHPQEGTGSGFVFDRDGHIITNYHVVENASEIMVSFHEGMDLPGQIIGTDPPNDLAVLQIDQLPPDVEPIPLGDSGELQVGQRAIAIGNPFGQFERTLTVGVISAVNRTLILDEEQVLRGVIQTDASINRGNSGGPLLDSSGRLIGINTAIFSPSGTSAGVGLAIPVNKLKRVAPSLIADGNYPHPWLGIERLGYPLFPELAQGLKLPVERGLLIAQIFRNSPAVRAGIQTATDEVIFGRRRLLIGGDILTDIDGIPLTSWEDLEAYLDEKTEVGQTITLTLWRQTERLEIRVELDEEPM